MCIGQSVGRGGINRAEDVKSVQILLNLNIYQLSPLSPLIENRVCGVATIAAIELFQRSVRNVARPDGKVDPNGGTLAALRLGLLPGFTEKKLQGIYIHAGAPKNRTLFPRLDCQNERE